MLLIGNLFLHFRELHIQEQNKVSHCFINYSRKILTTKFWSYVRMCIKTYKIHMACSTKHKGSPPLTHESVEPLYVPQRNLASVWCPFLEIKSLWSERAHTFLSFFFGCCSISLLSPLCSQSISGLSFICGLSNICELGELHTYSDLPRYPSRAGQYNNNIWYWLLLLYSICSIKEWFKMQSYCSYKIVHTRRKIQCQFFSLNNDIRSLFYYMLSVH